MGFEAKPVHSNSDPSGSRSEGCPPTELGVLDGDRI